MKNISKHVDTLRLYFWTGVRYPTFPPLNLLNRM